MTNVYDVKKYAEFSKKSFSWKYLEGKILEEKLRGLINKDLTVIEAGCGDGRLVKLMVELGIKPKDIIGIDLSDYLLEEARKDLPEVRWIEGSIADDFEIKEGVTDLVTCSMVLNYLNNKELEKFLKNCNKWLKEEGWLLIAIPHPIRMTIQNLDEYFDRKKRTNDAFWGEKVIYFHRTVADYLNKIIEGGFEIKEIIEPELSEKGKEEDKILNQGKYAACPMRLVIMARKCL